MVQNGIQYTVTIEDLHALSDSSPEFRSWIWNAFLQGSLESIVYATITSGRAKDVTEALHYIKEFSSEHQNGRIHITVADRGYGKPRAYLLGDLLELVMERQKGHRDICLTLGIFGHTAISCLMRGMLPEDQTRVMRGHQLQLSYVEELPLFEDLAFTRSQAKAISFKRSARQISSLWRKISETFSEGNWESWRKHPVKVRKLEQAIAALFGDHVYKIWQQTGDPTGTLRKLTVFSWAAAVAGIETLGGIRPLFCEVPVLSFYHGLSGGRIDALSVKLIGDEPPNRAQLRVIGKMSHQTYKSCAEIIHLLISFFRKPISLEVVDWKFLIGDLLVSSRSPMTMESGQFETPAGHQLQMARYLSLIPLEFHLRTKEGRMWEHDMLTLTGRLCYVFPHQLPVVKYVELSPTEREQAFVNQVVLNLRASQNKAMVRHLNNVVIGHALSLIDGKPRARRANNQPQLFAGPNGQQSVLDIAHSKLKAPKYIDDHQILEVVGVRNGEPIIEMHLDRAVSALREGRIEGRRLNPGRGGMIRCLMPGHNDSSHSLYVYFRGYPHFFCWGCRVGGNIRLSTIPEDVFIAQGKQIVPSAYAGFSIPKRHTIPEEHMRVMAVAKQILSDQFPGSAAEAYMGSLRYIDPDLAHEYGAGYGNDAFIHNMLDSGFSLDDLIDKGFVGLSERLTPSQGIVPLLGSRGISPDHCRRVIVKKKVGAVEGYPFSPLHGRVTFPLSFGDRPTNFYGRSIDPNRKFLAHCKLSFPKEQIEQGAFNMDALDEMSESSEMLICEGVMDALSLIQMGHPYTIAMVGLYNMATMYELAHYDKDIGIALDNDKSGKEAKERLMKWLLVSGHTKNRRDFTEDFLGEHPGEYKDYNEYWIKYGRFVQA